MAINPCAQAFARTLFWTHLFTGHIHDQCLGFRWGVAFHCCGSQRCRQAPSASLQCCRGSQHVTRRVHMVLTRKDVAYCMPLPLHGMRQSAGPGTDPGPAAQGHARPRRRMCGHRSCRNDLCRLSKDNGLQLSAIQRVPKGGRATRDDAALQQSLAQLNETHNRSNALNIAAARHASLATPSFRKKRSTNLCRWLFHLQQPYGVACLKIEV